MGSTFIGINGNGFWMRDGILELWLRLAALHIEEPQEDMSLAALVRNQWLLASRGYFSGSVPFRLEENVATSEGRSVVLAAFDSLLRSLRKGSELLDARTLNLMGFEGEWTRNIDSMPLIEVGESLIELIHGERFSGLDSRSFMPGTSR